MKREVSCKLWRSRSAFLKIGWYGSLVLCAALCPSRLGYGQEGRGQPLPDGDGKQLVLTVCSQCHGMRETQLLHYGQKGWEEVVNRMVLYGAQLNPSEADRVTRYLTTALGPGTGLMRDETTPAHGPGRDGMKTVPLPEGPGGSLVASRCVLCHDLGRVTAVARSKSDWESITISMMRGLGDTPNDIQTMISYLQANFSTNAHITPHLQTQPTAAKNDLFTKNCLICHSTQPGKEKLGPSLFGEMREPHPRKTAQEIRSIVRDGKGKMPPFKDILSEEDTDNLIAYIRSL